MAPSPDPEVARLTAAARELTAQARRLARSIDDTVEELREFTDAVAGQRERQSYSGPERRSRDRTVGH